MKYCSVPPHCCSAIIRNLEERRIQACLPAGGSMSEHACVHNVQTSSEFSYGSQQAIMSAGQAVTGCMVARAPTHGFCTAPGGLPACTLLPLKCWNTTLCCRSVRVRGAGMNTAQSQKHPWVGYFDASGLVLHSMQHACTSQPLSQR